MQYEAERAVPQARDVILRILLDVARVPDWNPALTGVGITDRVPSVDRAYRVRVRGVVPATLRYVELGPERVRYRLETLGHAEDGEWLLHPADASHTTVVHRITHSGPILQAMSAAFEPVPHWRLERLALIAARPSGGTATRPRSRQLR